MQQFIRNNNVLLNGYHMTQTIKNFSESNHSATTNKNQGN